MRKLSIYLLLGVFVFLLSHFSVAQTPFSIAGHESVYQSLVNDPDADSLNPYALEQIPLGINYSVHGVNFDMLRINGFDLPHLIGIENTTTHVFAMQVQTARSRLSLGKDSRIYRKSEGSSGEKVLTLDFVNWIWPNEDSVLLSCQFKFYEKDRKIEFLYGPNNVSPELFTQMGDTTVLYITSYSYESGPATTPNFWYCVDHSGQNLSLKTELYQFGIIKHRPVAGNGYVFYYESPMGIDNETLVNGIKLQTFKREGLYTVSSLNNKKFRYALFDTAGRQVQKSVIANTSVEISILENPAGLYLIGILFEDGTHQSLRLIK